MSRAITTALQSVERMHENETAATRRQLIGGAAAALGTMGLIGLATSEDAFAANDAQTILNIAATAEVLATIVNTVGAEKVDLDKVTRSNIRAAAIEEKIHYEVLVSPAFGGVPLTKKIWVPDAVFKNDESFLSTVIVGDQIFINAYMIATTVFGDTGAGGGKLARITSEFMGAEAVHRALARQSLGLLGNDRVFMKFDGKEEAKGPGKGMPGFTDIGVAVEQLKAAGFGFGEKGAGKGRFYNYDTVSKRTPNPKDVNTRAPQ